MKKLNIEEKNIRALLISLNFINVSGTANKHMMRRQECANSLSAFFILPIFSIPIARTYCILN